MLGALLPLFALVAAGWLVGRTRRSDPAGVVDVILYLFMPLLLFTSLVRDPVSWEQAGQYVSWYAGFVLSGWALVALTARLRRWPRPDRNATALVFTGVNIGSVGIPLVLAVVGEQTLSGMMLLLVSSNVTAGTVGVYLAAGGRLPVRSALLSVFRLPLVYAVGAALAVSWLDVPIPHAWLDTGFHIGMVGPPLALAALGMQLARINWGEVGVRLIGLSTAKLCVGCLVGAVLVVVVGAQGAHRETLLLVGCLPSTINSVLLAARFDARPDLVGGVCLLSTVLSPLPLLVVVTWLG